MSRVGAGGPSDPGRKPASPLLLTEERCRETPEKGEANRWNGRLGTAPEGLLCLQASEVERRLSLQVHALREDFREKNSSTNQHILRLESLQAEVSLGATLLGAARAPICVGAFR